MLEEAGRALMSPMNSNWRHIRGKAFNDIELKLHMLWIKSWLRRGNQERRWRRHVCGPDCSRCTDMWQQGHLVHFIHTQWGILGAWGESTLERHQDFEPNIWPTELETIGPVMMVKVLLTLCLSKNVEFFSFYWENLILEIISQLTLCSSPGMTWKGFR